MAIAFVLCALLLFTPHTSASRYEFGGSKALYINRRYLSINSTAPVNPTLTSLRTSTWANSSLPESSLSPSSTNISGRTTSGNVPVEPTYTKKFPPGIPSELPVKGGNNNPARPFPPPVSQDECDADYGCPSSAAPSLSQPTNRPSTYANASTPEVPTAIVPSVTLSSEQAACTGLITSPIVFVTSTTTIIETITLPFSGLAPDPTYITPVQPCLLNTSSRSRTRTFQIITYSAADAASFSETVPGQGTSTRILPIGAPPAPPPEPLSVVSSLIALTSTVLVTKKTSVILVATDIEDPFHYSEPQPSPTAVPHQAPSGPVIQVPSIPKYSVSVDLPTSTKAPQSEQTSSPSTPTYINEIVSSILGGPAALPEPEDPVQSRPQPPLTPSPPAAMNPGYSVVPAVKPGGSPNANNPSSPDTQGPINANPGNPSNSDIQQSNKGDSPASPTPSTRDVTTLTIKNIPVVLESGNIIINSQTFNAASPTSIVINGQTVRIDSSAIIVPGRTIALPPSPTSITLAGQIYSIDPARPLQLVGTGGVIPIPPNSQGSAVIVAGQTFTLNPSQIVGASTTLDLPALPSSPAIPTPVTLEGVTVSIGSSLAVIGSATYSITAGQAAKTVVYEGQTISVGPAGLGFVGASIALPQDSPTISAVTADSLVFSIGASVAIISGTTYRIGAGASSTVVTVRGEILKIGSSGVILPTQTIAPLATVPSSVVTAGGLTFLIEPSAAIISGTTYQIGVGASSTTLNIGGEVVTVGPDGVILPSKTIPPLATITPLVVTADSLTFSVEPGDVNISGTTYRIGSGATPTTLVLGTETVRIGPNGIALPSTTISPPSQTASETRSIPASAASSRAVLRIWCAIMVAFAGVLLFI